MRVVLVGDTVDRTNWGCRATSMAMRKLIADRATLSATIDVSKLRPRLHPAYSFGSRLVRSDRRILAGLGTPTTPAEATAGRLLEQARVLLDVGMNYTARVVRPFIPATPKQFPEVWDRWRSSRRVADWIEALADADAVIVNGEGSIRKNDASGRFALFLAWASAVKLGKPVSFSNHMCDIGHPVMRACVAEVYPVCESVVVRGTASLQAARELAAVPNLRWAPDAAFLHRPAPRKSVIEVVSRGGYYDTYPADTNGLDPTEPYVCVGGSALYQDGPAADQGAAEWFDQLTTNLAKHVQVVLLGHDFPDQALFGPIARRRGAALLGVQTSIPQLVDVLGGARAYVGGRWHSAVLAAASGTPILRLESNSPIKSKDLEDFAIPAGADVASLSQRTTPTAVARRVLEISETEGMLRAEAQERTSDFPERVSQHVEVLM